MKLKTHGDEVAITAGDISVKAEYRASDVGAGSLCLSAQDRSTDDEWESILRLDPWSPDGYEVWYWATCRALIVCGAQGIAALNVATLRLGSMVALEYEEADTIDQPWFNEDHQRRTLMIATERRVWCLDERAAIRWMWSARASAQDRWIRSSPSLAGDNVHVPVRTLHGDALVVLSPEDGLERPRA